MSTTSIWIELDGTETQVFFDYNYSYQAAKLNGAWENCYPEEEEFEFEIVDVDHRRYSAIELWELYHDISEDVFFQAAQEDMAADREDYGDYLYQQRKDDAISNVEGW